MTASAYARSSSEPCSARHIEVVCAATGSEALERIERDEPDVVVCDVVMPDSDGYEICDFVKATRGWRGTPVLLMSGIVNDEVRERAARVKSADVLSKPFAADDLLRKLDALLASAVKPAPIPPSPFAAPAPVNGNGHVQYRRRPSRSSRRRCPSSRRRPRRWPPRRRRS